MTTPDNWLLRLWTQSLECHKKRKMVSVTDVVVTTAKSSSWQAFRVNGISKSRFLVLKTYSDGLLDVDHQMFADILLHDSLLGLKNEDKEAWR